MRSILQRALRLLEFNKPKISFFRKSFKAKLEIITLEKMNLRQEKGMIPPDVGSNENVVRNISIKLDGSLDDSSELTETFKSDAYIMDSYYGLGERQKL